MVAASLPQRQSGWAALDPGWLVATRAVRLMTHAVIAAATATGEQSSDEYQKFQHALLHRVFSDPLFKYSTKATLMC
jgi:O-acetyl-ADP-ribose deacetylase (regulator of RNase III)